MNSGVQLVMSQGPEPGQAFALDQDRLTIGRDPSNDIVANDPQVSRHHASITRDAGGLWVEDLGSTNGTFVNGMRLRAPLGLNPGDVIGLGEVVTLTLYDTGEAATADMDAPPARPAVSPPLAREPAPPPWSEAAARPMAPPPSFEDASVVGEMAEASPYDEDETADEEARRRQRIFIGCGCGALVLACVAIALFLWFAPASFWEFLVELGIPIPPNPF